VSDPDSTPKSPQRIAVEAIVEILRAEPDDETRGAIMHGVTDAFCRHCWRPLGGDEYCQCWNDE